MLCNCVICVHIAKQLKEDYDMIKTKNFDFKIVLLMYFSNSNMQDDMALINFSTVATHTFMRYSVFF